MSISISGMRANLGMIPSVSTGIDSATMGAKQASLSTGPAAIRDSFQKMAGEGLKPGKNLSSLAQPGRLGGYLPRLGKSRGRAKGIAKQMDKVLAKLQNPHFQAKQGLESLLKKRDQIQAKLQSRSGEIPTQTRPATLESSSSSSQTTASSSSAQSSSTQQGMSTLDPSTVSKSVNSQGLSAAIKDVESQQEELRNQRDMAQTSFQNFDQKSNQMYNLLSSVLKTMNEMRMGTIKSML